MNMKTCLSNIVPKTVDLKSAGIGMLLICFAAFVFYDSWIAIIFLSPYLYFWQKEQRLIRKKKERRMVAREGKDFFQSMMNCLSAGYSLEQSIPIIRKELNMIYQGKSIFNDELKKMERKLTMNQSFEKAFEEFARVYENEDFLQFLEVLKIAKRKGGNLIKVLDNTMDSIHRKNMVEEEISTMLAGRVLEKNIMKAVPVFLICYLRIFNGEYLSIMYLTLAGRIMMTISLCAMLLAGRLADRIAEIEV